MKKEDSRLTAVTSRLMWWWPLVPLLFAAMASCSEAEFSYKGEWPLAWVPLRAVWFLGFGVIAAALHLLGRWLRRGSWPAWFVTVCFSTIVAEETLRSTAAMLWDNWQRYRSLPAGFGLWLPISMMICSTTIGLVWDLLHRDTVIALAYTWRDARPPADARHDDT